MATRAAILFVTCISLCSCGSQSTSEVMRAASPDGSLFAHVFEGSGGATTDYSYDVVLGPPGESKVKVASFYGAGRSDCASGVNIRWAGKDALVISYYDAKSERVLSSAKFAGRTIQIVARAGIADMSAPCGGMDYAQQGKVVLIR